jgi:hypothetical protein
MVDVLAPDRSDQPFGKAILPRRGWCSRLSPYLDSSQIARNLRPSSCAETLKAAPQAGAWTTPTCRCTAGVASLALPLSLSETKSG